MMYSNTCNRMEQGHKHVEENALDDNRSEMKEQLDCSFIAKHSVCVM